MEIRQATKSDLDQIIQIEKICFPPAEAAKESDLRRRFEVFSENFLVATNNSEVVGFINGCTTDRPELPDELYHNPLLHRPNGCYQTVFGLDVLPQYRNQGIAAQLLSHLIELSQVREKEGMVLTCKGHLVSYYERFGFKHKGVSVSSHGGSIWNDMVLNFKE